MQNYIIPTFEIQDLDRQDQEEYEIAEEAFNNIDFNEIDFNALDRNFERIDHIFTMYETIKTFGVDRSFVALENFHGEFTRDFHIRLPSVEMMNPVGDPTDQLSVVCLEKLGGLVGGIWNFVKKVAVGIYRFIKKIVLGVWHFLFGNGEKQMEAYEKAVKAKKITAEGVRKGLQKYMKSHPKATYVNGATLKNYYSVVNDANRNFVNLNSRITPQLLSGIERIGKTDGSIEVTIKQMETGLNDLIDRKENKLNKPVKVPISQLQLSDMLSAIEVYKTLQASKRFGDAVIQDADKLSNILKKKADEKNNNEQVARELSSAAKLYQKHTKFVKITISMIQKCGQECLHTAKLVYICGTGGKKEPDNVDEKKVEASYEKSKDQDQTEAE
jgi:hypothetical protein